MRVLIVEDEPRLRELLVRALPDMGFEPSAAASGEEAIRALAIPGAAFDILILDLHLPGMNGLDLLEKARQKQSDVQAIVLTGHGDLDAARRAIHLDVADFLTKPCHLGEIEAALERARRRRPGIVSRRISLEEKEADAKPQASSDAAGGKLDDVERTHILAALARHGGNRAATADELGISLRTLYYRLSEYQKQGYVAQE